MLDAGTTLFALSDPTRRAIVERLRTGPRPVGRIAAGMRVSRPAVSQHLAVLRESGLVTEQRAGRRRIYQLERQGLEPLRAYVDRLWTDVLGAYRDAALVEAQARDEAEKEDD